MRILGIQQGWMDHMMGWGGGGWLWMLLWLVVLVLVGVAAWRVIQASAGGGAGGGGAWGGESALEILRRRYARGEIDREEFERKKRDLQGP